MVRLADGFEVSVKTSSMILGRSPRCSEQQSECMSVRLPMTEQVLPAPVCPYANMQQLYPWVLVGDYFKAHLHYFLSYHPVDIQLRRVLVRDVVECEHLLFILSLHHQLVLLVRNVQALPQPRLRVVGLQPYYYFHLLFSIYSTIARTFHRYIKPVR